jgi:hypothetical protein
VTTTHRPGSNPPDRTRPVPEIACQAGPTDGDPLPLLLHSFPYDPHS